MVVTGKGPLRDSYMQRVIELESSEKWQWVRCRSMWVEAADYPLLLGKRSQPGVHAKAPSRSH